MGRSKDTRGSKMVRGSKAVESKRTTTLPGSKSLGGILRGSKESCPAASKSSATGSSRDPSRSNLGNPSNPSKEMMTSSMTGDLMNRRSIGSNLSKMTIGSKSVGSKQFTYLQPEQSCRYSAREKLDAFVNTEKEQMMENTVERLNRWLDEKFELKIVQGVFEFGLVVIEVPENGHSHKGASGSEELPSSPISAQKSPKKEATLKKKLRCVLLGASKLVVKRCTKLPGENDDTENDLALIEEVKRADASKSVEFSPYDESDFSPDDASTRENSPSLEDIMAQKETEASKGMLNKMHVLWEKETQSKHELEQREQQQTIKQQRTLTMASMSPEDERPSPKEMVSALAEGREIDIDIEFICEPPSPCNLEEAKEQMPIRTILHEADQVRRMINAPIAQLLATPIHQPQGPKSGDVSCKSKYSSFGKPETATTANSNSNGVITSSFCQMPPSSNVKLTALDPRLGKKNQLTASEPRLKKSPLTYADMNGKCSLLFLGQDIQDIVREGKSPDDSTLALGNARLVDDNGSSKRTK